MSPEQEEELIQRVASEQEGDDEGLLISIGFTPSATLCLIANLQLALRHPGNNAHAAEMARNLIAGLIARLNALGFVAHAEVAALGNEAVDQSGPRTT